MFRRKRSSSNASTTSNTTPAAATAAVQAFVKRQPSEASLSSAAAAAALRTHATSPVPVGEIQTKRMMRRGSVSSIGSGVNEGRPGLHRRGSSGSMTERSFRSPSPGGRPPVPKIPADIPPIPNKSHRRSASQEAPALRIASPTPADGARGVSMDRGTSTSSRRVPTRPQSLAQVLEQPDQQQKKVVYNPETRKLETLVFRPYPPRSDQTPKTANGSVASGAKLEEGSSSTNFSTQDQYQTRSSATVANNKKKLTRPVDSSQGVNGSIGHAATGAVLASKAAEAPSSPSFRPISPAMSDISTSSPGAIKKRTPFSKEARGLSARPASVASQRAVSAAQAQKNKEEAALAAQRKAAAMLARPLSSYAPVMEERPVVSSTVAIAKNPQPATASGPSSAGITPQQTLRPSHVQSKPDDTSKNTPSKVAITSSTGDKLSTILPASQAVRTASVSPARSAHFSDTPVVAAIKHAPPPRSISPAKSALKSHSPQRASSPHSSRLAAPESADGDHAASDDGASPSSKRKSVRVSFDEAPVAIGVAATPISTESPMIASPQNSRFPAKALLPSKAEDENMGSRPLLPSFGSVRGRKEKGADQMRTLDDSQDVQYTSSPLGSSNDHLVGSILSESKAKDDDLLKPTDEGAASLEAPAISIVPATPHPEDEKQLTASNNDGQTSDLSNSVQNAKSVTSEANDAHASSSSTYVQHQEMKHSATGHDDETSKRHSTTSKSAETAVSDSKEPATESAVEAEDWDQVRAYWTSLSEHKKIEIEQNALGSETTAAPLPPWPDHEYRKSVVDKTHSTSDQKPMRKSMREADSNAGQQPRVATGPKTGKPVNKVSVNSKPQLQRKKSNDSSASESSFKRSRRRSRPQNSEGGRYTMRASMRDGLGAPNELAATGSSRTGLRHEPAAKSLRSGRSGSIDGGSHSKESGGFFGLGKSKSKAAKSSSKTAPRFQSRFADSSDEDEPSSNWRSRFADSDDSSGDEVPAMKLTPVRGIPRKSGQDEGDSTELDDSDDEAGNRGVSAKVPKNVANGSVTSNHDMPTTMRPPATPDGKKSKRSFFGIGKKKNDDGAPASPVTPSAGALSAATAVASGNVENSPASPARQTGSKLSKSMRTDQATRNRPNSILRRFSSPSHPAAPSQSVNSSNFPFPVPPIPDEYKLGKQPSGADRPNTSDGVSETTLGRSLRDKRQSAMATTDGTARPSDNIKPVIVSARTGKPKKFQGLRRVFKMTD